MTEILTLHEGPRGCGHRKEGGLYLIGGRLAEHCGRLPFPLDVCPTCHAGVKPTRGWTWIAPDPFFFPDGCSVLHGSDLHMHGCPLGYKGRLGERAGLLWIGEKFYPTPDDFLREGAARGVSRRLTAIPKGLEVGKSWVLLAHRKAVPGGLCDCGLVVEDAETKEHAESCPSRSGCGIFSVFLPNRIDYVVKGTETEEELAGLTKRGVTLVRVIPHASWEEAVAADLVSGAAEATERFGDDELERYAEDYERRRGAGQ